MPPVFPSRTSALLGVTRRALWPACGRVTRRALWPACGRVTRRGLWPACGLALVLLGCKLRASDDRRWTPCTCAYVTDYDDPGKITVEVCADAREAPATAQSCAQNAGVGAVTECACRAPVGTRCGSRDVCRDVSRP
jgi:hypothetical protein